MHSELFAPPRPGSTKERLWRTTYPAAPPGSSIGTLTIANDVTWRAALSAEQRMRWATACGSRRRPSRYPPVTTATPYDATTDEDLEDRLMLDPEGSMGSRLFVDFHEHRWLIGVDRGHPGHPAVAAPVRSLAAYWLAAVYGLKWFMNFTQLGGKETQ